MRRIIVGLLATGMGFFAVTHGAIAGLTSAQLTSAGFLCFNTGPHNWVHCLNGQLVGSGRAPIPVMVFTEDGMILLGTEQLIHERVYAGQPCPQDGQPVWEPVAGIPYLACHHFATD